MTIMLEDYNIFLLFFDISNAFVTENHRNLVKMIESVLAVSQLYYTQFITRIYWNRSLAASDIFPMFTQSIKFYNSVVTY